MKVTINVPDYALKLKYSFEGTDGEEFWTLLTLNDIVSIEHDKKEDAPCEQTLRQPEKPLA